MTRPLLLFGLAPALLGACQATHLLYVNDTVFGIDVAASAEGSGHMVFGYDRETFALVPRNGEDDDKSDAMSLAAVSCVYVDGLQEVRFNHFVATGPSAIFVTEDETGYATIRAAIFGKEAPLAKQGQEQAGQPCD